MSVKFIKNKCIDELFRFNESAKLRAPLVTHVPLALRALGPTVLLCPTCLVLHLPCAVRAPVFHVPRALCGLMPCAL